MRLRTWRVAPAVTFLVALSGCPGLVRLEFGTWIFTHKITNQQSQAWALDILPNGAAQASNPVPPAADAQFAFVDTWERSGSTFSMIQTIGEYQIYTGTIHSNTSMSGTWAFDTNPNVPVASWVAVFYPG